MVHVLYSLKTFLLANKIKLLFYFVTFDFFVKLCKIVSFPFPKSFDLVCLWPRFRSHVISLFAVKMDIKFFL